jgi:type IV pilus assembly protein PilA
MEAFMNTKLKLFKNQKGMTLIELLAVIVILGVIAAIAVPAIGGTISSSKTKADANTVLILKEVGLRYASDQEAAGTPLTTTTAVATSTLVSAGYLSAVPTSSVTPAKSFNGINIAVSGSTYTVTVDAIS